MNSFKNISSFIKVEFDPDGGSSFSGLSTTQLLAVSYAFCTQTVENEEVKDTNTDPANEIQTLSVSGNDLTISDGNSVILPGGETKSAAEYEVSWTIGEPIIETSSSGSHSLTQGFHQPKLTVTSAEIFADDLNIEVYPNPTWEFVTIYSERFLENAEYALFSLSGKKLMEGKIMNKTTKLSIENRASGSYLLKLTGENSRPLQTFKIVKR